MRMNECIDVRGNDIVDWRFQRRRGGERIIWSRGRPEVSSRRFLRNTFTCASQMSSLRGGLSCGMFKELDQIRRPRCNRLVGTR